MHAAPVPAPMPVNPAAAPAAVAEDGGAPVPPPDEGQTVKAPMVGTFYTASAPGAKPFVQVGTEVAEGDVICIIEAMKMMNQIESEIEGQIVAVLVENGEPVEFGQPLFIIE